MKQHNGVSPNALFCLQPGSYVSVYRNCPVVDLIIIQPKCSGPVCRKGFSYQTTKLQV